MTDTTVPVATFETRPGADEGAELLRANGIRCAVVDPPVGIGALVGISRPVGGYAIVVASDDEEPARETLDGFPGARWFLVGADGRRTHAFESATPQRLRRQARDGADPGGWAARDCERLAGLLEHAGHGQVFEAFRHESVLEGRTLAEWARSCGCEPVDPA